MCSYRLNIDDDNTRGFGEWRGWIKEIRACAKQFGWKDLSGESAGGRDGSEL